MPSGLEHVQQAEHNINFLDLFHQSFKFKDWTVTVSFYSCVHIIENAIFEKKELNFLGKKIRIEHSEHLPEAASTAKILPPKNFPGKFQGHNARLILARENFPIISTSVAYLYNKSRSARYYVYDFTDGETLDVLHKLDTIIKWSNVEFKTAYKSIFS